MKQTQKLPHQLNNNQPTNNSIVLGLVSGMQDSWNKTHEIEELILTTQPKLGFFNCWTGGGKTAQALELISNILGNSYANGVPTMYNKRLIFATFRVIEVLEGLMRLRNQLIKEKGLKHYKHYLSKLFVRFDKSSQTYKEAINTIESMIGSGSPFTSNDLKWLKKFVEEDVDAKFSKQALIKLFNARAIITTHASMTTIGSILGSKCSEYNVFVDELPYSLFTLSTVVENDSFERDIEALKKSNTNVLEISAGASLAKQFKLGLLEATVKNNVRAIHYSTKHPFKSMVIASASMVIPCLLMETVEGIELFRSNLNDGLIEQGLSNIEITRKDFNQGDKVLHIETSSTASGLDNCIQTNLTGVNSYSGFSKVELHGHFQFPNHVKSQYSRFFGDDTADAIEFLIFKDRLAQSLYRSCIRRGEKVIVKVNNEQQAKLVTAIFECN